jgi:hypothetical protein
MYTMYKRRLRRALPAITIIGLVLLALLLPALMAAGQSTPQFLCATSSGYGAEINPNQYLMDLQCQPALRETLVIDVGRSRTFTVSLANYYAATGRNQASFDIHLAMDRARIVVREADALEGQLITDTLASLADVAIVTQAQSYTFVIENRGLRSAVFDLTLRPR